MVGIVKVWLLREHRKSDTYYLTTSEELVRGHIRNHRRHWGSLVWTRSFSVDENKGYNRDTYLWLLKNYLDVCGAPGISLMYCCHPKTRFTCIGEGTYVFKGKPGEKVFQEFRARIKRIKKSLGSVWYLFDNNRYSKVLDSYRPVTKKKEVETSVWKRITKFFL